MAGGKYDGDDDEEEDQDEEDEDDAAEDEHEAEECGPCWPACGRSFGTKCRAVLLEEEEEEEEEEENDEEEGTANGRPVTNASATSGAPPFPLPPLRAAPMARAATDATALVVVDVGLGLVRRRSRGNAAACCCTEGAAPSEGILNLRGEGGKGEKWRGGVSGGGREEGRLNALVFGVVENSIPFR